MSDTPDTPKPGKPGKSPRPPSPLTRSLGPFVKRLRTERGLTQEELAELADLAPDTIRRLEWGSFSPSLDTLAKLVAGLRLDLTALFTAFEHGESSRERELLAVARSLSQADLVLVLRLFAVLVGLLGGVAVERAERAAGAREDGHDGVRRLDLATLFKGFGADETGHEREIVDVAHTLSRPDLTLVLRLFVVLVGLLGNIATERTERATGEREDGHG